MSRVFVCVCGVPLSPLPSLGLSSYFGFFFVFACLLSPYISCPPGTKKKSRFDLAHAKHAKCPLRRPPCIMHHASYFFLFVHRGRPAACAMHHASCFFSPQLARRGRRCHVPCTMRRVFFHRSWQEGGGGAMCHASCVIMRRVFFFTVAGKKARAAVPCAMHHASCCFFSTAASEAGGGGTMRRASWFVFFARGWRDAMRPAPPPPPKPTQARRVRGMRRARTARLAQAVVSPWPMAPRRRVSRVSFVSLEYVLPLRVAILSVTRQIAPQKSPR